MITGYNYTDGWAVDGVYNILRIHPRSHDGSQYTTKFKAVGMTSSFARFMLFSVTSIHVAH